MLGDSLLPEVSSITERQGFAVLSLNKKQQLQTDWEHNK